MDIARRCVRKDDQDFPNGNVEDINHFMKVWAYARSSRKEGMG